MPKKPMVTLTESMFYVLLAFQNGEMCGTDIADYVDRLTAGRVQIGPATLYTILGKFENEKYIMETNVEGRKRTYAITDKGMNAYNAELARLNRCIEDSRKTAVMRRDCNENELSDRKTILPGDPLPVL